MANTSAPFGALPTRYLSGAPYAGAANRYGTASGDATALFIGDFVKLAGTGTTYTTGTAPGSYANVTRAATGDIIVGVVVGVGDPTFGSTVYRAGSSTTPVMVADDPNLLFAIQEAASGTALTVNDLGLNIDFVVGAGSTVTGLSGTTLDNTTEATTNTLDLKLVGFENSPVNEIGSIGAVFTVRINRHQYANQIDGV